MEIEPEVIPPNGRSDRRPPPRTRSNGQSLLAGAIGLAIFLLLAWLFFWFALILLGIGLVSWAIRSVVRLITGEEPKKKNRSNFQVTIRRGPPPRR